MFSLTSNLQNLSSAVQSWTSMPSAGSALARAADETRALVESARKSAGALDESVALVQREVAGRARPYVNRALAEAERRAVGLKPLEKLLGDAATRAAALAALLPGSLREVPGIYGALFGDDRGHLQARRADARALVAGIEARSSSEASEVAPVAPVEARPIDPKATLTFGIPRGHDGWEPTLEGRLVAGKEVEIHFEPSHRFPSSLASAQGGYAQWGVTGFAKINGGEPVSFEPAQQDGQGGLMARPHTLALPEAGTLELWFRANDRYGHVAYDSHWDSNYRLSIESA